MGATSTTVAQSSWDQWRGRRLLLVMPSQFTCEHRAGWSTCAWLIVRVSTANLHAACARLCQQRCVTLGSVGVDGCWCWLHCVTLFGAFHPKRLCVIRLGPHGSPWVPMGPSFPPSFQCRCTIRTSNSNTCSSNNTTATTSSTAKATTTTTPTHTHTHTHTHQ